MDRPLTALVRNFHGRAAAVQAVLAGLGIAFLSAHTIELEVGAGRIAVLDVVGLPIMRTWYIVHLAERRLMPGTRALCDFLTSEGRRFLPDLGAALAPC